MPRLLLLLAAGMVLVAVTRDPPAVADEPAVGPPSPTEGVPRGRAGGRGPGQRDDPRFIEDRNGFHFLLENRGKIQRSVTRLPNGVETVTESDTKEVADGIRAHVAAMHGRVTERRGIHMRDPLFREVFRNADKIVMEVADTDKGVRVRETSADPNVAKLIHMHSEVVSRFMENGYEEVRRNHAVPSRDE